jgi:hypothetical protein
MKQERNRKSQRDSQGKKRKRHIFQCYGVTIRGVVIKEEGRNESRSVEGRCGKERVDGVPSGGDASDVTFDDAETNKEEEAGSNNGNGDSEADADPALRPAKPAKPAKVSESERKERLDEEFDDEEEDEDEEEGDDDDEDDNGDNSDDNDVMLTGVVCGRGDDVAVDVDIDLDGTTVIGSASFGASMVSSEPRSRSGWDPDVVLLS